MLFERAIGKKTKSQWQYSPYAFRRTDQICNEFNRGRGSCVSKNYSVLWDYMYQAVTEHLRMFNNVRSITITSFVLSCLVVFQVTGVFKESVTI
jgi:hypothetical protein